MNKKNIWLFFEALGRNFSFDFIGRLLFSELFYILNIIFINFGLLFRRHSTLLTVLKCLVIFLLAQIISDIINNTSPIDYLRGWSMIMMSMVAVIVMTNNLENNDKGILTFIFVLMISNIFFSEVPLDFSSQNEDSNYFKSRIVPFLNCAIYLISYYIYRARLEIVTVFLFFGFAVFCFAFEARSNGFIFMVTAMLLFLRVYQFRITTAQMLFISLIFLSLLYFFYIIWVDLVVKGGVEGSNSAIQLALASNIYNPFELLFFGRTDFFALIGAIADEPLFGHGSWGKDPTGKYSVIELLGTMDTGDNLGYIKAHSVFLGSWAWAGLLGFVSVFYMFFVLFRLMALFYLSQRQSYFLPIIIALTVDMFWAFFFSPLGLLRTTFPLFASILILKCSGGFKCDVQRGLKTGGKLGRGI